MPTAPYQKWATLLASLCIVASLASCSRGHNASLTVLIPQRLAGGVPTLRFPDIDGLDAPTVQWTMLADTAFAATFFINEQQLAILSWPKAHVETPIIFTPRQPVTLSLRAAHPTVLQPKPSSDFQRYWQRMKYLGARYSPYDSLNNASIADSMRAATLQYIHSYPLSKGVLIALQAVGPDSAKLLPLDSHLSLYLLLDSLLQTTYRQSKLLQSLSQATNAYARFRRVASLLDSTNSQAQCLPVNSSDLKESSLPRH